MLVGVGNFLPIACVLVIHPDEVGINVVDVAENTCWLQSQDD